MELPLAYNNFEAEQAVLGCLITEGEILQNTIYELTEDHFYSASLSQLFRLIKDQYEKYQSVSIASLSASHDSIQIVECMEEGIITKLDNYMQVLERCRKLRKSARIIHSSFSNLDSLDFNHLSEQLLLLDEKKNEYPNYSAEELTVRAIDRWDNKKWDQQIYRLGIPKVDDLIRLKSGNMMYINAPPKVGKTWLQASVCEFLARNNKVYFISAETHPDILYSRICSKICGFNITDFDYVKNIDKEKLNAWRDSINIINNLNFTICNARGINFSQLKNKIKYAVNFGYDIIIIDYLQRISFPASMDIRVATLLMSRDLTNLASKHNKLIICASQASPIIKSEKITKAYHSKESKAVAEDADVILSLTNATDYKKWKKGDPYKLIIDISQRNGYSGIVELYFNPQTGTYKEVLNVAAD